MVESQLCELKLVVHAVRDIFGENNRPAKDDRSRGKGRKPHDPILLTAITYLMLRRGWSFRDAERWCKENTHLLRQLGYTKPNPPSRMAFKRRLDSLDPAMLQRITAKVKHLKGELKTLWF